MKYGVRCQDRLFLQFYDFEFFYNIDSSLLNNIQRGVFLDRIFHHEFACTKKLWLNYLFTYFLTVFVNFLFYMLGKTQA